jgi:hypothetical protein
MSVRLLAEMITDRCSSRPGAVIDQMRKLRMHDVGDTRWYSVSMRRASWAEMSVDVLGNTLDSLATLREVTPQPGHVAFR